jgi:hypothetical protein
MPDHKSPLPPGEGQGEGVSSSFRWRPAGAWSSTLSLFKKKEYAKLSRILMIVYKLNIMKMEVIYA